MVTESTTTLAEDGERLIAMTREQFATALRESEALGARVVLARLREPDEEMVEAVARATYNANTYKWQIKLICRALADVLDKPQPNKENT